MARNRLWNYDLRFEIELPLDRDRRDPSEYVTEIKGVIEFAPQGDVESIEAGTFSAQLVQLDRAIDEGCPPFDVFDAHSSSLFEVYERIFGGEERPCAHIVESFDFFGGDILHLATIEIDREHRGLGLGLAMVSQCINIWGPDQGLVVCKPFPLQWDVNYKDDKEWKTRIGSESFSPNRATAERDLKAYWKLLGFRKIRGSDLWGLSTMSKRPTLSTALNARRRRGRRAQVP